MKIRYILFIFDVFLVFFNAGGADTRGCPALPPKPARSRTSRRPICICSPNGAREISVAV